MPAPRPRHPKPKIAYSPRHARASVLFPLAHPQPGNLPTSTGPGGGRRRRPHGGRAHRAEDELELVRVALPSARGGCEWKGQRRFVCRGSCTGAKTKKRTRAGRGPHDSIQRNGRGPDVGRTIAFKETDADRTRAWPFLSVGRGGAFVAPGRSEHLALSPPQCSRCPPALPPAPRAPPAPPLSVAVGRTRGHGGVRKGRGGGGARGFGKCWCKNIFPNTLYIVQPVHVANDHLSSSNVHGTYM
eukprot:gene7612-biopygen13602